MGRFADYDRAVNNIPPSDSPHSPRFLQLLCVAMAASPLDIEAPGEDIG